MLRPALAILWLSLALLSFCGVFALLPFAMSNPLGPVALFTVSIAGVAFAWLTAITLERSF